MPISTLRAGSLPASDLASVAERLAAIRHAISEGAGAVEPGGEQQFAWGNWWRNGGWRNGGWGNWAQRLA
jgi:hypothetical protein